MATLGIFTVKLLHSHEGRYYTFGGFGEYLAEIRSGFERTVLVAHVAKRPPGPGFYEIPADNLEVVHLPAIRGEHQALLTLPVQFARCLRAAGKMDVAHVRMPDYTGVVGAVACRLRGVPHFNQIIADWAVEARAISWRKRCGLGLLLKLHMRVYDWLERLVSRGQLVFAQGESCYAKHRGSSKCHQVMSSAHRASDLREPTPRFGRPLFQILSVGRLTWVKNQALLLRALAELTAAGESWSVTLVGAGHLRPGLEALARDLAVSDRVVFAGQLARGEVLWREFDAADVFVLPSHSEGTPKALLEAMCRGVPVIATAVGGIPTMVRHEQSGLLFPDNDLPALVLSLRRLAADSLLREKLAWGAHKFAASQTVEKVTEEMLDHVFEQWPNLREHDNAVRS